MSRTLHLPQEAETNPNAKFGALESLDNPPDGSLRSLIKPTNSLLANSSGGTFKDFLTPQNALPSTMFLVPDTPPNSGDLKHSKTTFHSMGSRPNIGRFESDNTASASEQEIAASFLDTNAKWSTEALEELMYCLKEKGLLKCLREYLTIKGYSVSAMLRAFGKNPKESDTSQEQLLEKLQTVMRQVLRKRSRTGDYSAISDAVKLLRSSKRIMVLTGAGISVSCGIPDFRSADGIYAIIKASGKYDDLDDPQEMFSLSHFIRRPSMFYSFIGQLWPQDDVQPSVSHEFIRLLEAKNKLLRNYTQNIDGLELAAGVERVYHCHGTFKTAKCMDCNAETSGSSIHGTVVEGKIPQCEACLQKEAEALASAIPASKKKSKPKGGKKRRKKTSKWNEDDDDSDPPPSKITGLMKPSITFFGEKLSDTFDDMIYSDREEVDLLLIMGTSLKVRPVSEILAHIPHSIPQILINKTPIEHVNPDIVLLGNSDVIVSHLCSELEWSLPSKLEGRSQSRRKGKSEEPEDDMAPQRLGSSHVWLFEGYKIPMPYAREHDPTFTRERKNKRPRLK